MGVWQMSQQEPFPDFKSKVRDVLLDLQDPIFIALQYIALQLVWLVLPQRADRNCAVL